MSEPLLLDLFCCQGGASMGYHRAGFGVVGIDKDAQPRYPFPFLRMDSLEALDRLIAGETLTFTGPDGDGYEWYEYGLEDFAAAHASPPCQLFTSYRRRGDGVGDSYENLIPDARERLQRTGLRYVIENVETARAELVDPILLCGSSFGLDVRRHRLFESKHVPDTGSVRSLLAEAALHTSVESGESSPNGRSGCLAHSALGAAGSDGNRLDRPPRTLRGDPAGVHGVHWGAAIRGGCSMTVWYHQRRGRVIGEIVRRDGEWVDIRLTEDAWADARHRHLASAGSIITLREEFLVEVEERP